MAELILRGAWHDGVWGDHTVWANPPELGFAFIGIRKSIAEDRIIERIDARRALQKVVAAIVGGPRYD